MAAGSYQEKKRITDIIEAMRIIDRRFFVDNVDEAYLNEALPIAKEQTVSHNLTQSRGCSNWQILSLIVTFLK